MFYVIFFGCLLLTLWINFGSDVWKMKKTMTFVSSAISIGIFTWAISIKDLKPVSFESIEYLIAFSPLIVLLILLLFRYGGRVLAEILESIGDILS